MFFFGLEYFFLFIVIMVMLLVKKNYIFEEVGNFICLI